MRPARLSAGVSLRGHWVVDSAAMDKIEALEKQIESLSPEELAVFRQWYHEFDALAWDRQLESDVRTGKLDALADEAIKAQQTGKCTEL